MRGPIPYLTVLVLAACIAAAAASSPLGDRTQSYAITISTPARPGVSPTTASYTLACNPVGGTLPLATRICADIAKYPQPTLRPLAVGHWVCGGVMYATSAVITVADSDVTTTLHGTSSVCLPQDVGVALFIAAANRHTAVMTKLELELQCDRPSMLDATAQSLVSCMHALWTPRSEQLIRDSEAAADLQALRPAGLFPHRIGTLACSIPAGGPPGATHKLSGLCEVSEKNVWSKTPTVTFSEEWPVGGQTLPPARHHARHVWQIVLHDGQPTVASQTGAVPPQMWK